MSELPSELGIGNAHHQYFVRAVKTHVIRAGGIEQHKVANLKGNLPTILRHPAGASELEVQEKQRFASPGKVLTGMVDNSR